MKQYMHALSNPRKAVLKYGMFDQIRVDRGKEFFLVLGMQEQLQELRRNQSILCHTGKLNQNRFVSTLYRKSRNLWGTKFIENT